MCPPETRASMPDGRTRGSTRTCHPEEPPRLCGGRLRDEESPEHTGQGALGILRFAQNDTHDIHALRGEINFEPLRRPP